MSEYGVKETQCTRCSHPEACAECLKLMKERAEEVDILQLGVGLFANKAVIKRPNGALATIPLSELIIKD